MNGLGGLRSFSFVPVRPGLHRVYNGHPKYVPDAVLVGICVKLRHPEVKSRPWVFFPVKSLFSAIPFMGLSVGHKRLAALMNYIEGSGCGFSYRNPREDQFDTYLLKRRRLAAPSEEVSGDG